MPLKIKPALAFSIDFEGFIEGMEQSFPIPDHIPRYEIEYELQSNLNGCLEFLEIYKIQSTFLEIVSFPTIDILTPGKYLPCFNLLSSTIHSISLEIPKKFNAVVAFAGDP